ncbi:[Phe13]-bombesin receptor-like protein [Leptotrombidium deliense]|uniref:[Phe13]-bombesin receptor-like protein n=1 Tax=Leptotrombidium deliense TaxID=299467 RepID=A0A443S9I8_9ACAR|nr:[Phe13]-bombesin receptor-like protein [Leptotrombidium deliense]
MCDKEGDESFYINCTGADVSNTSRTDYVPYERRPETYVVPIIFAIVFIAGLIGNVSIVYFFIRHKKVRTVPNTYILSLSIGDLLIISGALPFVSLIYTVESWPYGEFVCKLSEFVRDLSISVTVITLTALSGDRCVAISAPLHIYRGSKRKHYTIAIAVGIWILSVLLAYPGAYFSFLLRVNISEAKEIFVCYPFPDELGPFYSKFVVLFKFLMFYAIPLSFITIFYLVMSRHLINSSKTLDRNCKSSTIRKHVDSRTKLAKVALFLIVTFAVCFFPNHVFMLWFYFNPRAKETYNDFWHYWRITGFVLTFINSCLNPIILYITSSTFRVYFRRYLCVCSKSDINLQEITTQQMDSEMRRSKCSRQPSSPKAFN